jgi:hypothetical protein
MTLEKRIKEYFRGNKESLIGSMMSYGFTSEELDQAEEQGLIEYEEGGGSVVYNRTEPVKYVIIDWMSNRLFPNEDFDSFEEGWVFLYSNVEQEDPSDNTFDDYYIVPEDEV